MLSEKLSIAPISREYTQFSIPMHPAIWSRVRKDMNIVYR